MARYDRAFLVPYLQDLCTLYLAKRKTEGLIYAAREKIERIQWSALNELEPPELEAYIGPNDLKGSGCGLGCGGMICGLLGFGTIFSGAGDDSALIVGLIIALAGAALMCYSFGERNRQNTQIKARNDEKERQQSIKEIAALASVQSEVDAVEEQITFYRKEIGNIDVLLQNLYDANLIPGWYRDFYPAVYLYDWFSNGRSDDLDMALNTFVLEQIKDKLDIMIRNQSEELLNQRIMIANQLTAIDQQNRHHQELMSKLERMEYNDENRNTYLKMMSANTAANAYFSAADYLKK